MVAPAPPACCAKPQDASLRDREGVPPALRDIKREWRNALGIEEMGVLGSFARGSATDASDLDIDVRTQSPNPYLLVHLKEAIEGRVHRKVDIVRLRERMNPLLGTRIEQEGIDG
jgi:predicted nucleotidyltransferase